MYYLNFSSNDKLKNHRLVLKKSKRGGEYDYYQYAKAYELILKNANPQYTRRKIQ